MRKSADQTKHGTVGDLRNPVGGRILGQLERERAAADRSRDQVCMRLSGAGKHRHRQTHLTCRPAALCFVAAVVDSIERKTLTGEAASCLSLADDHWLTSDGKDGERMFG